METKETKDVVQAFGVVVREAQTRGAIFGVAQERAKERGREVEARGDENSHEIDAARVNFEEAIREEKFLPSAPLVLEQQITKDVNTFAARDFYKHFLAEYAHGVRPVEYSTLKDAARAVFVEQKAAEDERTLASMWSAKVFENVDGKDPLRLDMVRREAELRLSKDGNTHSSDEIESEIKRIVDERVDSLSYVRGWKEEHEAQYEAIHRNMDAVMARYGYILDGGAYAKGAVNETTGEMEYVYRGNTEWYEEAKEFNDLFRNEWEERFKKQKSKKEAEKKAIETRGAVQGAAENEEAIQKLSEKGVEIARKIKETELQLVKAVAAANSLVNRLVGFSLKMFGMKSSNPEVEALRDKIETLKKKAEVNRRHIDSLTEKLDSYR